jgi:hypothetical protein
MFPYQPIDKKIATPGNDTGRVCFSFDGKWLPIMFGLLQTLQMPQTWQDPDTGINESSLLIQDFMTAALCANNVQMGRESECDCMGCCLRWSDTGMLQQFVCGEWVDVPGNPTAALANGSQPATGAPQPAPGGCEEFLGKVQYGGRWLLPVPINSGDTLRVSGCTGATTDYALTELLWRCGDGLIFFGGTCVEGSSILDPSAPMPSAPQQALIAFDGTNYYNCAVAADGLPVDITIPPGITDKSLVFLVNDEVTFGAGDLSFSVRVCKPTPSPLGIAYSYGTGPASAVPGNNITVTSVSTGFDQHIDMSFSECVKITILSIGAYVETGSGGNNNWAYFNCALAETDGPLGNSGLGLSTFPTHVNVKRVAISGAVGTPYSLVIAIEAFAP